MAELRRVEDGLPVDLENVPKLPVVGQFRRRHTSMFRRVANRTVNIDKKHDSICDRDFELLST